MAAMVKDQKDKLQARLSRTNVLPAPRQTAASAARAAHNATNRNIMMQNKSSHGPRQPHPIANKVRSSPIHPNKRNENKLPTSQEKEEITPKSSILCEKESFEQRIINLNDNDDQSLHQDDTKSNGDQSLARSIKTPIEPDGERPQPLVTRSRPQSPKREPLWSPIRPLVPAQPNSRPITPSQRPITPTQRPPTPTQRPPTPTQRPLTPSQRPITPIRPQTTSELRPVTPKQRPLTPRKPATPQKANPQDYTPNREQNTNLEEGDIKAIFREKRKQFQRLKKDLDMRQQEVLEVFDSLQSLRKRMVFERLDSGEGMQVNDLVVFNVSDWAKEEIAQLCQDVVASSNTDGAIEFINTILPYDENALGDLDGKLLNMPTRFADLCLQAFTSRQEVVDWVKELLKQQGNCNQGERIDTFNAQGIQLCETLRNLKTASDNVVETATQLTKRAIRERSVLVSVGESLVREIARLRSQTESHEAAIIELQERARTSKPNENTTDEDLRRQLAEERAAKIATKEKLSTVELQLRQARARVTKMDRQLREADSSITSLTATVKTLEDQSRQREVQLEARARKLRESLKTTELTSNQLTQQRNILQAEVEDLKDHIQQMTEDHQTTVKELRSNIKELEMRLKNEQDASQKQMQQRERAEQQLVDSRNAIKELNARIQDLERSVSNTDLPNSRELHLWSELQATKETLRAAEEEVTECKREKVRFLETLTKISDTEQKAGLQQKLATELMNKEKMLGKMQIQIRELSKNMKLHEHKVLQYEQYVNELLARSRNAGDEECDAATIQDLQKELMDLKMNLLEAAHRNEQLSELLAHKDSQLEKQDKTSRAQARVIKVREELINMLKNKESEQGKELAALQQDLEQRIKIVDDVKHQIAEKADEIQDMFSTLESKQQQIHRLEKIVLALEEQQRRAQHQRTRHEEKIAALEHELAASGSRGSRKFLFF